MNTLNNLGVRGQLLFAPSDRLAITLAVDDTRQRPEGYTQVVAGVAPTLRPANRQYPQIAAGLGYTPPSFNAFDRLTDVDTPLRSYQDLGGASLNVDWKLGPGRLTSTTRVALLGLESVERSRLHRPAGHHDLGRAVEAAAVDAGGSLRRGPVTPHRTSSPARSRSTRRSTRTRSSSRNRARRPRRFLLAPSANAATPGLLDGYGYNQYRELWQTPARRCSASSNGRSPIACACCPACGSTTTRRTWTSISRSTAACRRPIRR